MFLGDDYIGALHRRFKKYLFSAFALASLCLPVAIQAIPSLQLGDGSIGDFFWEEDTETWVATSSPFSLMATAKGKAWDKDGKPDGLGNGGWAYLVLAAMPQVEGMGMDLFDVQLDELSGNVSGTGMVAQGYGNPPIEDPNSIAPHGIFDTYFQVWEFQFNDPMQTITNTQPGSSGSTQGYAEELRVTLSNIHIGVSGVHADLFTVSGDGRYDPSQSIQLFAPASSDDLDKKFVKAFAPFSHDAEFFAVPEPTTWALLGTGLAFLGLGRRRIYRASEA